MKNHIKGILVLSLLLLSGCSDDLNEQAASANEYGNSLEKKQIVKRQFDPIQYSNGQKLYAQNCAVCHGKHAEGADNWQRRTEDGKFPPPPLNGTAHTWHHSTEVLTDVIKNGTGNMGGNMPAWKNKLNDKDIANILVFIQAQWSDEIYTVWYNNFHATN